MKSFQDLLKDVLEDEALRFEAKKALNSDSLKVTEEQYAAVVDFGKAHGYDFTEEDIHMYRASNREMDDNELEMVSGGSCVCGDGSNAICDSSQKTEWGGQGRCSLDYACIQTWNSCTISNKCIHMAECNGNAY